MATFLGGYSGSSVYNNTTKPKTTTKTKTTTTTTPKTTTTTPKTTTTTPKTTTTTPKTTTTSTPKTTTASSGSSYQNAAANPAPATAYSGGTGYSAAGGTGSGGAVNTGSGYNNGGLSADQVAEMQSYYGTAADGKWGANSTAAAGGLDAASAWNNYQSSKQSNQLAEQLQALYSDSGSYAQALAEQQAANDAAVKQAVNRLYLQKDQTQQSYADMYRQLYIDSMNRQKDLDQLLAAQGITGGEAESTRLGYDTAYSDALRQGEQARVGAMNDLDNAITDVQLNGEITNAEAAAENAKARTDSYAAILQALLNRADQQEAARASVSSGGGNQVNATQKINKPAYIGGMAADDYEEAAGNYQAIAGRLSEMRASGDKTSKILSEIRTAYDNDLLTTSDYIRLYNQYRG